MKTAFISTIRNYPWGGADALWTPAAESALDRGDSIFLAVNRDVADHERIARLIRAGADWHSLSQCTQSIFQRVAARLFQSNNQDKDLSRALARFSPDLVILSGGATYDLLYEPVLADWLIESKVRFRYLANWQENRPVLEESARQKARDLLEAAEKLFFVSSANLENTRNHLLADLPHAELVQYPVRLPSDGPLPWPEESPLKMAAIARLEPVKGLDLLIRAAAGSLAQESNWQLDVYGRGPDQSYLENLIRAHKLQGRVRLAGYSECIDTIWETHHLLVSASLAEGSPLTFPEAMLRGRPILATEAGGTCDWITHGHNGFICPAATTDLLGRSLQEAWDKRADWREMGRRAAQTSTERYRHDDHLKLIQS